MVGGVKVLFYDDCFGSFGQAIHYAHLLGIANRNQNLASFSALGVAEAFLDGLPTGKIAAAIFASYRLRA